MKTVIKFYKEDGKWYADVPSHTKSENLMVSGADVFLDKITITGNTVYIKVDTEKQEDCVFLLKRFLHTPFGGTYKVQHSLVPTVIPEGFILWLCNVTHDVIGSHTKYISILSIF